MRYYVTKSGKIINSNYELIPMDEKNQKWKDYYNYLKNNGEVKETDFDIELDEDRVVPQEVPLWCIKVILSEMGLTQSVKDALEQLEEPNKTRASFIWEYGNIIKRESQTVEFLGYALQKSKTEIDTIFINANNIEL